MKWMSTLLLVLVAGCGPAGAGSSTPGPGGRPPAGPEGSWRLTAGVTPDGRLDPAPGQEVTLDLGRTRAGGVSGCNDYVATVRRDRLGIDLADIGGTEMACAPGAMTLERRYLAALDLVENVRTGHGRLVLTGAHVRLEFATAPAGPRAHLVGTQWRLESLLDGDTATSALGEGTLLLSGDGRLAGSAGCLPFEARFEVVGDRLSVDALHSPGGMTDCSLQDQHDRAIEVLDGSPVLSVDADRLTLTGSAGRGLVYRAVP